MSTTDYIDCPVTGCSGRADDHRSTEPRENLHSCDTSEWDLPLDAHPVMDSTTWPKWVVYMYLHKPSESDPIEALKIAAAVTRVALLAIELNEGIDLARASDHADAPKLLRRPQQIDDELRALDE